MVWSLSPKNGLGFLASSTGVVCPSCGAKLRITQRRSALILALLFIGALAAGKVVGQLSAHGDFDRVWSVFVVVGLLSLSGLIGRRFAVLKIRHGLDTVDFPVERLKRKLSIGVESSTREAGTEAVAESNGLHNMSKEFWLAAGWAVSVGSALGALGSVFYFHDSQWAMFLAFIGTAAGRYLMELARGSESRN